MHGIIEHTGRRSGRAYRTPVLAFRRGDRVAFIVGYGLASDWMRNLQAAGGGGLTHRRRHYRLSEVELVRSPEGLAHLPLPFRILGRIVGVEAVLTARVTESRPAS